MKQSADHFFMMSKSSLIIAIIFAVALSLASGAETSDGPLLVGFRLAPPSNSKLIEKMNGKLDSIWIPEITFADASLREAVEVLKKYGVKNDANSAMGEKGINVVIKRALNDPKGEESLRVTIRNVTFRNVLQQVADYFHLKIVVVPYAVVLTDQ